MTKPSVATILAVILMLTASLGRAEDTHSNQNVSGSAIIADILVARPLGLVATVGGSALFIVGLPFILISGSTDQAAQKLVVEPAEYTFTRPLGKGI
jgi:hypothetical protein